MGWQSAEEFGDTSRPPASLLRAYYELRLRISDFLVRTRNDSSVPRIQVAPLAKYLDQLDYLQKLISPDHIGIGPDFIHGIPERREETVNRVVLPREFIGDLPWEYVKDSMTSANFQMSPAA
jgi:microsomal dipeptidase-like Zn-dependent dipeptidase